MDLYKLSIIQNASKFSENTEKDKIDNNNEEVKQSDIAKIRNTLTETLKEQKEQVGDVTRSKTANLKDIMKENKTSDTDMTKVIYFSAKKLLFGPGIDEKTLHRHVTLILRGLNYSLKLLKGPPLSYIESRQIVLKELKSINILFESLIKLEKNTKTLLLDLDETLITSVSKRDNPDRILFPEGDRSHPVNFIEVLNSNYR